MHEAFLLSRALLKLGTEDEDLTGDLSAATITADGSLWLASDEMQSIERLAPIEPYVFGERQNFHLADYVDLESDEGEIDIEGMDADEHYLWLTGSHSLKRKKTKGKNMAKDITRLATVKPELNRFLLARIPIVGQNLFASCSHPSQPDMILTAAAIQQRGATNALTEALGDDDHLGAFLSIPLGDKENGFNIEGLAVRGNHVFLGLRGPVMDGWAIILELELAEEEPGVLTLQQSKGWQRPYRKHFLDLDGLGIRELLLHNDDLLILAGPTMKVEGAMKLFRMSDALNHDDDSLSSREIGDLELLFVLPFTLGHDHAEGLACLPCLNEPDALLVVYDSPNPLRMVGKTALFGDIFRLPAA
ncbi:MAG: DUF3616 domain-containing protein [Oscillochloris sp.]|nr:DUF3616 domain-containing protein [Oscillochloris sp.]